MRAEQAGVIASIGLMSSKEYTQQGSADNVPFPPLGNSHLLRSGDAAVHPGEAAKRLRGETFGGETSGGRDPRVVVGRHQVHRRRGKEGWDERVKIRNSKTTA